VSEFNRWAKEIMLRSSKFWLVFVFSLALSVDAVAISLGRELTMPHFTRDSFASAQFLGGIVLDLACIVSAIWCIVCLVTRRWKASFLVMLALAVSYGGGTLAQHFHSLGDQFAF
jgi:hypothetical protein